MGRPAGSFWKDESAMTAVEYGLIASLIALSIIGAASSAGSVLRASYGNIANEIATD